MESESLDSILGITCPHYHGIIEVNRNIYVNCSHPSIVQAWGRRGPSALQKFDTDNSTLMYIYNCHNCQYVKTKKPWTEKLVAQGKKI